MAFSARALLDFLPRRGRIARELFCLSRSGAFQMVARLVVFALVGLYVFSLPVFEALAQPRQAVGTIVRIEGTATFTGENGSVTAHEKDPLYPYSTIKTGPQSRALILFVDDTEVTLGESAELTIDKYVFDPGDAEENQGRFSILRGAFLYVSGMLADRKDPDVAIKTAYGSIGIRGTVLWGGQVKQGYGIFVQEGRVTVSGPGGVRELPQGTGAVFSEANPPGPANAWTLEKIEDLRAQLAFSRAPDETDRLIEEEMLRNIERRQDYRKIMWPYKQQGWAPLPEDGDPKMSREFRQMDEKHRRRLRLHDERLKGDPGIR